MEEEYLDALIIDCFRAVKSTNLKRIDGCYESVEVSAYKVGDKIIRIDIKYK